MPNHLYEISCVPECGFNVRSPERDETVDLAMHHSHMAHPDMGASADMMREQVHEVGPSPMQGA